MLSLRAQRSVEELAGLALRSLCLRRLEFSLRNPKQLPTTSAVECVDKACRVTSRQTGLSHTNKAVALLPHVITSGFDAIHQ